MVINYYIPSILNEDYLNNLLLCIKIIHETKKLKYYIKIKRSIHLPQEKHLFLTKRIMLH